MGTDYTVSQYFEERYLVQKLIGKPQTTIKKYRGAIRKLDGWSRQHELTRFGPHVLSTEGEEAHVRLEALSDPLVAAVMAADVEHGWSISTANGFFRHVRSIWNHAWRSRAICQATRLQELDEPEDPPRTWTDGEIARLFRAAAGLPHSIPAAVRKDPRVNSLAREVCGIPAAAWWTALLTIAHGTGLRITPLMLSRVEDLDLQRKTLRVKSWTQKQRRGQEFDLTPWMEAALRSIDPVDRVYLFPWALDRGQNGEHNREWKALRRFFKRLLRAADLPHSAEFCFHCLRRKTATDILAGGGTLRDAQTVLGHSAESVTRRYIDSSQTPNRVSTGRWLKAPEVDLTDDCLRVVG